MALLLTSALKAGGKLLGAAIKKGTAKAIGSAAAKAASKAATTSAAKSLASFGGKAMHSSISGVRKMGSAALKYGGKAGAANLDSKIGSTLFKANKIASGCRDSLKKINFGIDKMAKKISAVSPYFKQQLTVLKKGFQLLVRPIGDLLGTWLRPIGIALLKIGLKFNKMSGVGGGNDAEDERQAAVEQLTAARQMGDPFAIAMAEDNLRRVEEKNWEPPKPPPLGERIGTWLQTFDLNKWFGDLWNGIINWFTGTDIGKWFVNLNKSITDWWNNFDLGTWFDELWTGITDWWNNFDLIAWFDDLWTGITDWWKETDLGKWFDSLLTGITDWWNNIDLGKWFSNLKSGITDWWKETDLSKWFSNLKSGITDWWKEINLRNWFSNLKTEIVDWWKSTRIGGFLSGQATGGEITKTGPYILHAGERVLNAGDNSRSASSGITINNVYNINANITNDLDIRDLADRLAELNETELRRRVSYI